MQLCRGEMETVRVESRRAAAAATELCLEPCRSLNTDTLITVYLKVSNRSTQCLELLHCFGVQLLMLVLKYPSIFIQRSNFFLFLG